MSSSKDFELFTKRIYQRLVNNDVLKPITVQHNVKLKGKSGCEHQIDVFWEYEIAGNMHRVAVECKYYNSLVPIGKVRDFFGLLQDLNDVRGIMVSRKGYQEGARKFAKYYGISLMDLRRPKWYESIGSITTSVFADIRHTLFLIDEGWIAEHNFNLERLCKRYMSFQFDKANYWRSASYFPIETTDRLIRDSEGNVIARLDSLGLIFLEQQAPGTIMLFPLKDGWVESRYWGPVKIREVKFEYENTVQETTINLAAEEFVDAILEDAISGNFDYIPKF